MTIPDVLGPSATILAGIYQYLAKKLDSGAITYYYYDQSMDNDNYVKIEKSNVHFIVRVHDNITHVQAKYVNGPMANTGLCFYVDMQLPDSLPQISNWIHTCSQVSSSSFFPIKTLVSRVLSLFIAKS